MKKNSNKIIRQNTFSGKKKTKNRINNINININTLSRKKKENNNYHNIRINTSNNKNKKKLSLSRHLTPHESNKKTKKGLNINRVKTAWRKKIPLLASYLDETDDNKRIIYNRNNLTNLYGIKTNISSNNIFTNNNNLSKKVEKTEYEKFLDIKNKLILKKNKIFKKSESYNNINRVLTENKKIDNSMELVNELNEKNKLINKLNNNLLEHNKITENRISLLIKDKNIINERLFMLQREKEEYKIKKECEIKKYIQDINSNQRLIKELNNEKEKLLKSKREIEQLNQKLKNIILEEKSKRYEYEYMYKLHKLDLDNNIISNKNNILNFNNINNSNLINKTENNANSGYIKNKESFMKLKYDND
jgi:hypothetical protein